MEIIKATEKHIPLIVPLFNDYRLFYKQTSDKEKAKKFLKERLLYNESVIFLAIDNENTVGFTQLYTTFSSVSMEMFYILNDLYVMPPYRGNGVGKALLNKAKELCEQKKFKGVALETANDNPAQYLYKKLGWKKDIAYSHYFWAASQNE